MMMMMMIGNKMETNKFKSFFLFALNLKKNILSNSTWFEKYLKVRIKRVLMKR